MRKFLGVIIAAAMLFGVAASAFAEEKQYANWNAVVDDMDIELDKALEIYKGGTPAETEKAAKKQVNVAYYQFYEKIGFERTVKARISGNRAGQVELQFAKIKKTISKNATEAEVKAEIETLKSMLREDAVILDPKSNQSSWASFWVNFIASISIILKEGFEAILIVGAILAYLVKSDKKSECKSVYIGSLIGIGASIVMAILLNLLAGGQGDKQELIEGLTMILATGVLFYTSNWMVSKSDAHQWTTYIKNQVAASDDKGSIFGLSFTAFLAVFREGAEIVLFYQALVLGAQDGSAIRAIWIGLFAGVVLLFGVYYLIRYVSIKLPLKPFFLGTSVIMLLMCVAFVGSGISEFVEGDFVVPHILNGWPTVDIIGIHPYVETLLAQFLFLIPVVVGFVLQLGKNKKALENAQNNVELTVSPKKKNLAAVLQIVLGYLGVGDFYLGKVGMAVLKYSLTVFGLFFAFMGHGSLEAHPYFGKFFIAFGIVCVAVSVVWVIADFILTLLKKEKDGNKLPVLN